MVLVKDADNFVVVTVQGELYYCQAGAFAGSIGGGTLLTFAAGDIFKVVVTPTSITLLRNGVQVRQFTSDGKMDGVTQDTPCGLLHAVRRRHKNWPVVAGRQHPGLRLRDRILDGTKSKPPSGGLVLVAKTCQKRPSL